MCQSVFRQFLSVNLYSLFIEDMFPTIFHLDNPCEVAISCNYRNVNISLTELAVFTKHLKGFKTSSWYKYCELHGVLECLLLSGEHYLSDVPLNQMKTT